MGKYKNYNQHNPDIHKQFQNANSQPFIVKYSTEKKSGWEKVLVKEVFTQKDLYQFTTAKKEE